MTALIQKTGKKPKRETLTEAYEVRAFRDESEEPMVEAAEFSEGPRGDSEALQEAKDRVRGHGEQQVVPDDCQFGDSELCRVA